MEPKFEPVRGKATICIANYKTLDFTRLCLRSIRKFTKYPCDVIVVDNDSQDESLDYLRSLDWIKLIEQKDTDGTLTGSKAEGSALDLGLANCDSEFFIAMHSDTFVQKENWLGDLIGYFKDDENCACVGTDKLQFRPEWQLILKKAFDVSSLKRKLIPRSDPHGRFRPHNRTICCLYRTAVLKREKLSFMSDQSKKLTSGQPLYLALVDRGYETVELPQRIMGKYILHLQHATQIVNPDEFKLRGRTFRRCDRHIRQVMSSDLVQGVLADDSLDK